MMTRPLSPDVREMLWGIDDPPGPGHDRCRVSAERDHPNACTADDVIERGEVHKMWAEGAAYGRCQAGSESARLRAERPLSSIWDLEEKALAEVAMWPEWKRKAAGLRPDPVDPPAGTHKGPPDIERQATDERQRAIWTDGRDSEAARAYRGDGTPLADWGRLEALAREVEAATADAVLPAGNRSDWLSCARCSHPDPDYTPAVRRVVRYCPGWDVEREDEQEAYEWAARSRMHSDGCHTSASTQRFRRRMMRRGLEYYTAVLSRLASLLRHWDEKAGHR